MHYKSYFPPIGISSPTGAALLARERHEHLVPAVAAADADKAVMQVATLQKGRHRALDDRPPETILGLIAIRINLLEIREMLVHHTPQVRRLRVAWAVQRQRLGTSLGWGRGRHDLK